jgi:flagellar protein FlbD
VILVHRLRGEPMFINEDLIESIESTPDTVVTLVDGRKIVVADDPELIVERARLYRASVLAATSEIRTSLPGEVLPFRVADGGSEGSREPKTSPRRRRPAGGDI